MLNSKNFYINRYNFSSQPTPRASTARLGTALKKLKLYYLLFFPSPSITPNIFNEANSPTHTERGTQYLLFLCTQGSNSKRKQNRVLLAKHFQEERIINAVLICYLFIFQTQLTTPRTIIFHLLLCTFLISTMQITTIQ